MSELVVLAVQQPMQRLRLRGPFASGAMRGGPDLDDIAGAAKCPSRP